MAVFALIRVLLQVVVVIHTSQSLKALEAESEVRTCNQLRMDSHFEIEKIIGKLWRVYYSWDLDQDVHNKCHDISFKNATQRIVNRIWNDMYEYLIIQPPWKAAILLMFTKPSHEMLLFPDEGIPGRFIGVANVVRSEGGIPIKKNSVPLFKIYMKILDKGRYLVVADCNIGLARLAVRIDMTPLRGETEIIRVAESLQLGEGNMICAIEKNLEQTFEE